MARAKKPRHYLNNENLIREIKKSREIHNKTPDKSPAQCLTPMLIQMFIKLVYNYSQKANWRGYSWIEDMRAEALLILCKNALKFNEEKGNNPFGYYTQFIKNSFLSYIADEGKQRKAKDAILIRAGFNPSMTTQMENESYNEGSWEDSV